jgi:FkbM family methyltransferase
MRVLGSIRPSVHVQLARRDTSVLNALKRAVNVGLSRFGHNVVREGAVPSFDRLVSRLRQASLVPRTVIDIGVAYGTPWLYRAFPDAKFHLVDPTRESLPHMRTWADKIDAEVHNVALGTESTSMRIATRSTIIHSSLLREVNEPAIEEEYHVPVRRFDEFMPGLERPVFCKIDVEGAEMMVLRGMGERLHELDVVVIETSMISLYDEGPEFRDIVEYMSRHNFSLFDICAMLRRPFDDVLHQIDAAFVPDQSPLRLRRWN